MRSAPAGISGRTPQLAAHLQDGHVAPLSDVDLETLAEKLAAAAREHAAAVVAQSPARPELGRRLADVIGSYGVAIANLGGEDEDVIEEVEAFDSWLNEEDGVHHDDPDEEVEQLTALFLRVDVSVVDGARLRASALSSMQSCCPVPEGEDPASRVEHDADAVGELLGHDEHPLSAWLEERGLEVRHEASVAMPVTTEDFDPFDPFKPVVTLLEEEDAG